MDGGMVMISVQGYYDGISIKPIEKIKAKQNQRVIITIMDEFMDNVARIPQKSMRGALSAYADKSLKEKEKGAWKRAMVEKLLSTKNDTAM